MDHSNKIPGVTLCLIEAKLKQAPGSDAKRQGTIVLDATVEDLETWEKVIAKIDGLRIYTVKDLATTLIEVTQIEAKEALSKASARESQLVQDNERLKQSCSLMRAQLEKVEQGSVQWVKELDDLLASFNRT